MSEVKFTEEELKQVKEIQDNYFDIQNQFGQVSVAKIRLQRQEEDIIKHEDSLHKKFIELQDNERKFLDSVTDKYGQGTLNPETGIFTTNKTK